MRKFILALAVAALVPTVAKADAPLVSLQRVLVTAGLDAAKQEEPVGKNLSGAWEAKPSFNVAYNLGPHVSLVSSYSIGLKAQVSEYKVGIRVRLFDGSK